MDVKELTSSLRFAGKAVLMAERLLALAAKAGIEAPKRRRRKAKSNGATSEPSRKAKTKAPKPKKVARREEKQEEVKE